MSNNRCAICGGPLEDTMIAEYESIFGKYRADEVDVVCDPCWKMMDPANNPHLVEETMAETLRDRQQKE